MRRLTTEQVVEKFMDVHGDTYLYDKVDYKNAKTNVVITCRIHGDFLQMPDKHRSGHGCPICAKNYIPTNEEIISRFNEIHNGIYDYSKTKYVRSHIKVCVACKKCGNDFWVTPTNHLKGRGCPYCNSVDGHEIVTSDEALSQIDKQVMALDVSKTGQTLVDLEDRKQHLINQFKIVHNDFYDYSEVDYVNARTIVAIICPIHGKFMQAPYEHRNGNGCPKCAGNATMSRDELIERFRSIHGDKYIYDNVKYTNTKDRVEIICKKHGAFMQVIGNHLAGKGCPICNSWVGNSRGKYIEMADGRDVLCYVIKCFNADETFYKIGMTIDIKNRFASKEFQYDYKLIESYVCDADTAYDIEQIMHRNYKNNGLSYKPKIKFGGYTECYSSYIEGSLLQCAKEFEKKIS